MTYPPADGSPDPYQPPQPPANDPTLQYPPPYTPPTSPAPSSGPGYSPTPGYKSATDGTGYPPAGAGYPPPSAGYGPPPGYGPPGAPGYGAPYPHYGAQRPTNGLAIASLICSLAGLVTCISAPVGVVLGHIAKKQIRQTGEAGDGMATAGLWVGYILSVLSLIVIIFYVVVAVWAISEGAAGNTTF
ncbi:DUF4190 domain-containing protein [Actinoplanes hulinensis]|uniref:DUF4190 domain-containing protein n=1 Tax=Actinoplanes hulinensis TaxID=1144547 RepID=A0ABS7AWD2_9ACTN|nr:DUF4190 domain-containing protein [Actinoplanes hulinensis]MBW6433052.1 DUF4190 domain-containing protein [Actinoplanes hulinensis]